MSGIVVCCTDGSEVSARAISAGLSLLDRGRWRVRLAITVPEASLELGSAGMPSSAVAGIVTAPPGAATYDGRTVVQEQERLVDMGWGRALDVAARVGLSEDDIDVLVGPPGPVLVDYLREQKASLVILGTRGLGGAARLFLGSVSDHILRHSPCPVLVGGEDLPEQPAGQVVVCVDSSERSVEAGRIALELFAPDLPVAVATVRPVPDIDLGTGGFAEMQQRQWAADADRVLTDAATELGVPDTELVPLDGDDAAAALAHLAEERPVRAFVIGSHGRSALGRAVLGSVAERIVRLSPALVCVVPRRPHAVEHPDQESGYVAP